jgi:hypothetical protein
MMYGEATVVYKGAKLEIVFGVAEDDRSEYFLGALHEIRTGERRQSASAGKFVIMSTVTLSESTPGADLLPADKVLQRLGYTKTVTLYSPLFGGIAFDYEETHAGFPRRHPSMDEAKAESQRVMDRMAKALGAG